MNDTQKLWQRIFPGLKIMPGDKLPADVQWHVCGSQPMPGGANHQGKCSRCLNTIYFSDDRPRLKKICVACVLKFSENHRLISFGTEESLRRAELSKRRN